MKSKLPPLDDSQFDGEKYRMELKNKKCPHKDVKLINNVIICKCGASWQGSNIGALWQAMQERNNKQT